MSVTPGWYIVRYGEGVHNEQLTGFATGVVDIGDESFLRLVVFGEEHAWYIRVRLIRRLEEIRPPGEKTGEEPPEKEVPTPTERELIRAFDRIVVAGWG